MKNFGSLKCIYYIIPFHFQCVSFTKKILRKIHIRKILLAGRETV